MTEENIKKVEAAQVQEEVRGRRELIFCALILAALASHRTGNGQLVWATRSACAVGVTSVGFYPGACS